MNASELRALLPDAFPCVEHDQHSAAGRTPTGTRGNRTRPCPGYSTNDFMEAVAEVVEKAEEIDGILWHMLSSADPDEKIPRPIDSDWDRLDASRDGLLYALAPFHPTSEEEA